MFCFGVLAGRRELAELDVGYPYRMLGSPVLWKPVAESAEEAWDPISTPVRGLFPQERSSGNGLSKTEIEEYVLQPRSVQICG